MKHTHIVKKINGCFGYALGALVDKSGLSGFTQYYVPFGASDGSLTESSNLQFDGTDLKIASGSKIFLDGGTNTYFVYNSTSEKIEIFVKGIKKGDWG